MKKRFVIALEWNELGYEQEPSIDLKKLLEAISYGKLKKFSIEESS